MNVSFSFERNGEAPRGFQSNFGNILQSVFELKNLVVHILAESEARSTTS